MQIGQLLDFYYLKRRKRCKISATPSVEIARLKLRECSIKYHSDATEDNRIAVQEGKQKQGDAYQAAQEQLLEGQVRELEEASWQGRNAKSWTMINKITGKAPSYTDEIKGNSPTERVQKWKDYFEDGYEWGVWSAIK